MKRIKYVCTALLMFTMCIGCSAITSNPTSSGTILLKTLPSVELQVDQDGKVVQIMPKDQKAKAVVKDITYEDRTATTVLTSLLTTYHEQGYLEGVDANDVQVTFKGNCFDGTYKKELQTHLHKHVNALHNENCINPSQTQTTSTPSIDTTDQQTTPIMQHQQHENCPMNCCNPNCDGTGLHKADCIYNPHYQQVNTNTSSEQTTPMYNHHQQHANCPVNCCNPNCDGTARHNEDCIYYNQQNTNQHHQNGQGNRHHGNRH